MPASRQKPSALDRQSSPRIWKLEIPAAAPWANPIRRDLDEQTQHPPWGRGRMRWIGGFRCRRVGAETSYTARLMLWVPAGARAEQREFMRALPPGRPSGKIEGTVEEYDLRRRRSAGDSVCESLQVPAGFSLCPAGSVTWAIVGCKQSAAGPLTSRSTILRGGFAGWYKSPPRLQPEDGRSPH